MEDFLYAYNQPKQFGKYDLFLNGKVTANELIYKILTEEGEYQNINIAEKVKEIEDRLQTHFTFEHVNKLPSKGKETVIYLVLNEEKSGDKDSYDEYMWDKDNNKFELIGSGSYAQQQVDLDEMVKNERVRATAVENSLSNRITSIENLNLLSVINLVNQLQSKITKLETTVEELKAHHRVEYTVEHENPTELTE